MFTVVHINRLKRAHTQVPETSTPTAVSTNSSRAPQKQKKCKNNEKEGDYSQEIPLGTGVRIPVDDENSDDSEDIESQIANNVNSGRQGQNDPEWEPSSSCLRRKSHSDNGPREVAYQLRSRPVYGPGQEVPYAVNHGTPPQSRDSPETATVVHTTSQSEHDNQPVLQKIPHYNLRKRI
jgi:hypothetical protein